MLYKTLKKGLKSDRNDFKWKRNKWYKVKGELDICGNSFHCSELIVDAMGYVAPEIIAEVEVRGKSIIQDDKQCWQKMKIIKTYNWTKKDSVSLAIYSAELILKYFEEKYPDDKRPRQAIQAAKKWLKNPTEKNRNAANAAANAANAAAYAAKLKETKQKIDKWILKRINLK